MPKLFDSLRGTRWIIWSSPVLLLVLILTLSARPSSTATTPPRHITATTLITPVTSPPTTVSTTATTTTTTTTLTKSPGPGPSAAHETTTAANGQPRSSSTVATGSNFATAPAPNDSGVALEGTLAADAAPVVVPLRGPGTWTLAGPSAIHATLDCGGPGILVHGTVTVAANTTCQLLLSSPTSSPWQLTPQP